MAVGQFVYSLLTATDDVVDSDRRWLLTATDDQLLTDDGLVFERRQPL